MIREERVISSWHISSRACVHPQIIFIIAKMNNSIVSTHFLRQQILILMAVSSAINYSIVINATASLFKGTHPLFRTTRCVWQQYFIWHFAFALQYRERHYVSNHRELKYLSKNLFKLKFGWASIKRTSRTPHHWPFVKGTTADWWIPFTQRASNAGSVIMAETFNHAKR